MSKIYFSFSRLRYVDKENLPSQLLIEKIQSIIGCNFIAVEETDGLAEKRYEAVIFGCDVRLEHWKFENNMIYTLSGRSIIHDDWESEDIIQLNDYFILLFNHQGMPGWYVRTPEEGKRDGELAGGEYVS